MNTLPKVKLNSESVEDGKMYIWVLPHGDKKVVWKNNEGNGIAEYSDFKGEDHWLFDFDLVGELYVPFELAL